MIVHDCAQRSDVWFALRAGKLTGSVAKDILANGKQGGEAVKRRDLRYKLVAERLTGRSQEGGYVNADMQWGIDHEAEALSAYEAASGNLVELIGFCELEDVLAGTSPDGFIGERGILSLKCPKTATHVSYIREGVEPTEHAAQNTHELWLTGRDWVDFVSYDPRLPAPLNLWIFRVTRTTEELELYGAKVAKFLAEVDTEVNALRTMMNLKGQLERSIA